MPSASQWFQAARPHTWANAFAPVIAGSGAAAFQGGFSWWRALLAAGVSWALIIGVNYANDYSDGIKGTDEDRTGPLRLTGSGIAAPASVKRAAFIAFGVAGVLGIALSLASAWWLILVGLVCILAAWFYTGGSNPYGYRGLGEVAVFTFFGLVAVCGTEFTQAGRVSLAGLTTAIAVGSISAAVNLANNLRDIPTDTEAGKITLAVRLGDAGTRRLWLILAAMPLGASLLLSVLCTPWALVGLASAVLLVPASRPIRSGALGPALIPVLGLTGRAMLAWSVITAVALAFGG
ncbi:1,4-dihydroxy-2-naphthoate polyprenyltransferase [Corynebacterium hindlerae]|uniref:1,4-dihydroxy-2-naphthoate octaprenyltransferase n=1 Tax=Corynebacterium hindlerae TaxID=699041 RepID=A0A7G5FHX1_9CORY|nr:1,4-dihydroxy-2-naphthoate polyprenyltransferase [Corynebacterium hindlerae]QMV86212.1 1,4-dihydroxy-2-naphthoate polyprenyltransferase [Corynebacterium hindlerae]